jgi:hypothetical protein
VVFAHVNMAVMTMADRYASITEDEADMWIWNKSVSPSCSYLTDQRCQRNLDNAITMLRTEKLHHFKLFQTTQTTSFTPADNSGMNTTMQIMGESMKMLSEFVTQKKTAGSRVKKTKRDIVDNSINMVNGLPHSPLSGRSDSPAPVWISNVAKLIDSGAFLNGCDEQDKPAWQWEALLRCVSSDIPPNHSFSPKGLLMHKRTELLKDGMLPDQFPTFVQISDWLLTEFTSEDAIKVFMTEFSELRPSSFDAPKFMQKVQRVLHKIRDIESASVIQQSFENKDPRPVYQFFMAILDHYERMWRTAPNWRYEV